MTLAVALYAGAFSGMEEPFRKFFRWTSLLLTAPVLLYSARPFFAGAWKDLTHARVGMDVPVALGLTLAYFGSVWATIADRGEVYFDSVVMFVFLLLGARVLELVARERAVREQESVVRSVPATARRLDPEDAAAGSAGSDRRESIVATVELAVGDRVRILPGESVPADGVIEEGLSSLDEALLTGESVPVARAAGERVIGGAVNVESPLVVRVTAVGEGTVLSALLGLVEQAMAAKPEISRVADRTAQWFVRRILVLAAGVGLYWAWADPGARAADGDRGAGRLLPLRSLSGDPGGARRGERGAGAARASRDPRPRHRDARPRRPLRLRQDRHADYRQAPGRCGRAAAAVERRPSPRGRRDARARLGASHCERDRRRQCGDECAGELRR